MLGSGKKFLFKFWFYALIVVVSITSCSGPGQKVKTKKLSTIISAEKVKIKWSIRQDIQKTIEEHTEKPIYILFIAEWCPPCKVLLNIAVTEGWPTQIHILNVHDIWVQKFASVLEVKTLPTLIVAAPGGGEFIKRLVGTPAIATHLAAYLE